MYWNCDLCKLQTLQGRTCCRDDVKQIGKDELGAQAHVQGGDAHDFVTLGDGSEQFEAGKTSLVIDERQVTCRVDTPTPQGEEHRDHGETVQTEDETAKSR